MSPEDIERIGKYYSIVPNPKDPESGTCIRLDEGLFTDTVIKFGKFALSNPENGTEDDVSAKYEYEFIYVPDHIQQSTISDEEGEAFEYMVGEILMKVLYEHYLTKEQEKDGDNNLIITSE
jgi:hypothetical protein